MLLPFMVNEKSRYQKVKEVCSLIEDLKNYKLFDDEEMYLPLILAINQYVADESERKKLIEVLTMGMSADEIYEKVMSSGVFEQGLEEGLEKGLEKGLKKGREEGEFNMALQIKESLGVDEAARISGFSKEELENEKLNK